MEEPTLPLEGETATPDSQSIAGFLTNNRNYQYLATRRFIVPRIAIPDDLYKKDLLELTGSLIPILGTPLSEEIVECVIGERKGTTSPVFIELKERGEIKTIEMEHGGIPFEEIKKLHFRNESERENIFLGTSDIPDYGFETVVSPELFNGGNLTASDLTSEPPDTGAYMPSPENLRNATHWAASVCLASHSIKGKVTKDIVESLRLLFTNDEWTVEETRHLEILRKLRAGNPLEVQEKNDELFLEIATSFVTSGIPGDKKKYIENLRKKFPENEGIKATEKIYNGDSELKLLDETFGKSITEKAIFLILTRTDITDCLQIAEEKGADPATFLTIGILYGLAKGRHELPVKFREEDLDIYLSQIELDVFKGFSEPIDVSLKINEQAGKKTYSLISKIRGNIFEVHEIEPLHKLLEGDHWQTNDNIRELLIEYAKNDPELKKYVYREYKIDKGFHSITQNQTLLIPLEAKETLKIRELVKFKQEIKDNDDPELQKVLELREALSNSRKSSKKN